LEKTHAKEGGGELVRYLKWGENNNTVISAAFFWIITTFPILGPKPLPTGLPGRELNFFAPLGWLYLFTSVMFVSFSVWLLQYNNQEMERDDYRGTFFDVVVLLICILPVMVFGFSGLTMALIEFGIFPYQGGLPAGYVALKFVWLNVAFPIASFADGLFEMNDQLNARNTVSDSLAVLIRITSVFTLGSIPVRALLRRGRVIE